MLLVCICSGSCRFVRLWGFCAFALWLSAFPVSVLAPFVASCADPVRMLAAVPLLGVVCPLAVWRAFIVCGSWRVVVSRPGFIYCPLWAFYFVSWVLLHLWRLSLLCGALDALQRFRVLCLAVCCCGVVSLSEFGRVLGIICPLFFGSSGGLWAWFPRRFFGFLCGFFSCHGSIIPGGGRRARWPFSASGSCCYNMQV